MSNALRIESVQQPQAAVIELYGDVSADGDAEIKEAYDAAERRRRSGVGRPGRRAVHQHLGDLGVDLGGDDGQAGRHDGGRLRRQPALPRRCSTSSGSRRSSSMHDDAKPTPGESELSSPATPLRVLVTGPFGNVGTAAAP